MQYWKLQSGLLVFFLWWSRRWRSRTSSFELRGCRQHSVKNDNNSVDIDNSKQKQQQQQQQKQKEIQTRAGTGMVITGFTINNETPTFTG
jgi:hypothetical protein